MEDEVTAAWTADMAIIGEAMTSRATEWGLCDAYEDFLEGLNDLLHIRIPNGRARTVSAMATADLEMEVESTFVMRVPWSEVLSKGWEPDAVAFVADGEEDYGRETTSLSLGAAGWSFEEEGGRRGVPWFPSNEGRWGRDLQTVADMVAERAVGIGRGSEFIDFWFEVNERLSRPLPAPSGSVEIRASVTRMMRGTGRRSFKVRVREGSTLRAVAEVKISEESLYGLEIDEDPEPLPSMPVLNSWRIAEAY